MKMIDVKDMPKLESPFVREMVDGNYIVTPKVAEGYEWVFTDDNVKAIEKLHGTSVSLVIKEGAVISVWNRMNRIPFINKNKDWIIRGLLNSKKRGYLELPDGQFFGELIGKKVNGNPYQMKEHLWIPFKTYAQKSLAYKSWGKYPKDFETISRWFKEDLLPLFFTKYHRIDFEEAKKRNGFVEGVVFTHPDGKMAKLRKDQFSWFKGRRHGGIK